MSKLRVNNVIMYRRWKMREGRGKASSMRYHLRSVLAVGLLSFFCQSLLADVTVTEPIGGNGISADTALNSTNGAAFTALGNIVIAEGLSSDFAKGTNKTLILTLPDGWRFSTAAGASVGFPTSRDITSASVAVTTSNVTVTLTVSGTTKLDTLTISGLEVQPLDGGSVDNLNGLYIYNVCVNPGTETIAGIFCDYTTFGLLYTTEGAPKALSIITQPSPTATAGVIFNPQPEVDTYDQFGNWCSQDYSTVIVATRGDGTGTLQGSTTQTALGGDVTYPDLSFNVANTNTILFTATGLTSVTSDQIVVGPNTANQLVFTTQPGSALSGFPFGTQPVVNSQDQYGNNSTVGLPAQQIVTMTLSSGAGPLLGTVSQDLGTSAGTGVASYTDLEIDSTGSKQLTASSPGFTNAVSSNFTVAGASFSQLLVLAPGESFAPGTGTGKTGTPTAQIAGTPFSVTVNAVDASYNLVNTVSDTVGITSSDTNAVLPTSGPLVSGTKTFSVTLKTGGSATVTASDITNPAKTASTSTAIPVNAGALAKLQLLAPGETAVPGTATGKTGSLAAQTAGTAFAVTVNAVDANWNRVSTNDTVHITASDTNAVLPANAALASGSGSFTVTLKTAGSGTVTASDVTHTAITASTSSSITVNAGALSQLQVLAPGETAAPGSGLGKSGAPTAQTAGSAFNVTVSAVDANWNLINTNDTVAISSSDTNATPPANAALVSGSKTFSVTLKTAGNPTVSASDVTHTGIASNTSSAITLTAGAFTKLQLLAPGETAAPGSALGKTGTLSAQTAGSAFNVTVNAVDANWNLINTNDTVAMSSSDSNATPPAPAALSSGSKTFSVTLKTAGNPTVTASDSTHSGITSNTSPAIALNPGAFTKLQVLAPGETASPGTALGKAGTPTVQTAGTALNVTVNAVDANWNLIATNDLVAITSSDANAALPNNATLVAGTQSFSVTLNTAGGRTVTASDITHTGITASTSTPVTVNGGAFVKLQLVLPGETPAPGTGTGKTGTPAAQNAGSLFSVTVNAVDANWNVINTNDTVAITSSDANATLPLNAALVSGTKSFSVTLNTLGTATVTASDVTHAPITASVSPSIQVNPAL